MSNGYVYYYGGSTPYTDAKSTVTRVSAPFNDGTTQVYQFPNRPGPFGAGVPNGYGGYLTEDWQAFAMRRKPNTSLLPRFPPMCRI